MTEFISGLILPEKERETDYLFLGGNLERKRILPGGDWRPYLPTEEAQATRMFDPYCCVSMSFNNAMEMLEGYLLRLIEIDPEVKTILDNLEALDTNGRPNFSDRYLARMSGTIPGRGNTMDKVFDAVREFGLVGEKVWPKGETMGQSEYYKEIPQDIQDLGKKFLEYFEFGYESLPYANFMVKYPTEASINEALEYSPLWVCVDGNYEFDNDGRVGMMGKAISYNHATTLVAPGHWVFDSYAPFLKQFVADYKFGYVKSFHLKKKRMYYKIKGNAAVFLLNPVSQKFSPFYSGDVYKVWNGTLGYESIVTVDNLGELLKIAPLDDQIITLSPWDSTSFTNSLKQ